VRQNVKHFGGHWVSESTIEIAFTMLANVQHLMWINHTSIGPELFFSPTKSGVK